MSPRPPRHRLRRTRAGLVAAVLLGLVAASCGPKPSPGDTSSSGAAPSASPASSSTVRLGYLPQLTQATALVGFQDGYFAKEAATYSVSIVPSTYSTAASELSALTSGQIDAAYVDPVIAIRAYEATNGGVKIVSGATSGGSLLMTKYYPQKVASNLAGATIATPEQGDEADVALRNYLTTNGLNPNTGGNVHIVYESNAAILQAYARGSLTGAWVDEQWAARLQVESDANVFVDEATTKPNNQYPTAVLVVRTSYLDANPNAVTGLLLGQVLTNEVVAPEPQQAFTDAAAAIDKLTGVSLSSQESLVAWSRLAFTDNPISTQIDADAIDALKLGVVKSSSISGIYDLSLLNNILQANGLAQISAG